MTDDDFEARLKALLNESVDRRTSAAVRVAPPFSPPQVSTRSTAARRAGWFLPLAIAACVAAVVTGAVVLRTVAGPDHRAPVVDHTTVVPQPRPTTVSVRLGDATIVLPVGWVARSVPGENSGADSSVAEKAAWCLSPASLPAAKAASTDCPLLFGTVDAKGTDVDVDTPSGYTGDPEVCFQNTRIATETESAQTRPFGGRSADWRHRDIRCTNGDHYEWETYVVATDPGYVLTSRLASASVTAAMTTIAQRSALPAATSTLRLFDRGRVTSISTGPKATRVTLTRFYETRRKGGKAFVDLKAPAVTYDIPAKLWQAAGTVRTGTLVELTSDGRAVKGFSRQA